MNSRFTRKNHSIDSLAALLLFAMYVLFLLFLMLFGAGNYQASVKSLDDLLAKDELLADFKAVKEGNVWITDNSMYQHTDTIGELINDLNLMLTDGNEEDMTFLHKLS